MDAQTQVATLNGGSVEHRRVPGPSSTVVVFHGGHLRAGLPLGEDALVAAGHDVLAVSRPGYGRTPLSAGPDPARFADRVLDLCTTLGIEEIGASLGVSAGGPAAVALAQRAPERVRSLVLVSARSSLPFPDGLARTITPMAFAPPGERATWAAMRAFMKRAPVTALRTMMGSLSTMPARQVVADLDAAERAGLVDLFSSMRSGAGFLQDTRGLIDPALERGVNQPTLVVASPHDGQVGTRHTQHLLTTIPHATYWASPSLSHLVWYGSGAAATHTTITNFLDTHSGPRSRQD
ncbi:MAG: alpha/beta hydrolase [Oerskovia sp.]|nr:alpha/beta hydrolase [Oerskovia sp.]